MSTATATNTTATNTTPGPVANAAATVPIPAPLARLVITEILRSASPDIPPDIRPTLEAALLANTAAFDRIAQSLSVCVNLASIREIARMRENQERRQVALTLCIQRGAHQPLLTRLFGATRGEVASIRKQLNAPQLTAKKPRSALDAEEENNIYAAWEEIAALYSNEEERWIALSNRLPQHSLATLYALIEIER